MALKVVEGNIFDYKADAIVAPANNKPVIGSGLDKEIYERAGKEKVMAERKRIGDIPISEAVATSAYGLDAKFIIHAVSPMWIDGEHDEASLLYNCYKNALECARKSNCKSVVFPLLSTGVFHYPIDEAMNIAESAINDYLKGKEIDVTIVVYTEENGVADKFRERELAQYLLENDYSDFDIQEYNRLEEHCKNIPPEWEEHQYLEILRKKYKRRQKDQRRYAQFIRERNPVLKEITPNTSMKMMTSGKYADERYVPEKSIRELFWEYLKESEESDATLAKRANMNKGTFAGLKTGTRNFSKDNAICIAAALGLTKEQLHDFLWSGDFRFPRYHRDFVIEFCFVKGFKNSGYPVDDINDELRKNNEVLIGEDKVLKGERS